MNIASAHNIPDVGHSCSAEIINFKPLLHHRDLYLTIFFPIKMSHITRKHAAEQIRRVFCDN